MKFDAHNTFPPQKKLGHVTKKKKTPAVWNISHLNILIGNRLVAQSGSVDHKQGRDTFDHFENDCMKKIVPVSEQQFSFYNGKEYIDFIICGLSSDETIQIIWRHIST